MPVSSIHYITDRLEGLEDLLKVGLDWVQLRVKGTSEEELFPLAEQFVTLCEKYKAYSIINDYPSLVMKVGADGVHLGKEDMPVAEARALLGDGFIIGGTANTYEDVVAIHEAGADYVGLGPFKFTSTKKNLSPLLGLQAYAEITEECRNHQINIPIIAIGGVLATDLQDLYKAGVHGVAVASAIRDAENPATAFQKFLTINTRDFE